MTREDLDEWAADQTCRHCGHHGIVIEWRLEARPIGSFSLAGAQMKFSAREHPYAKCPGCRHVSRGESSAGSGNLSTSVQQSRGD